MTTLTEFLEARLREDQEAAELMAKYYPPPWNVYDRGWIARVYGGDPFWDVTELEQGPWVDNDTPPLGEIIEHVARHDPARVLREVTAKRAILELHGGPHECSTYRSNGEVDNCSWCIDSEDCSTILSVAAVYSDHHDFDPNWSTT